jgi:hypothetical protein
MPKEPVRQPQQLNASQSSASNPLNETLEEIKVFKEPTQVVMVKPEKQPSFKKQPSERAQPSESNVYKEPS